MKVKLKDSDIITMVKIGIGMICSVLCCLVARKVELDRLSLTIKKGTIIPIYTSSMSVYVMVNSLILLIGIDGGTCWWWICDIHTISYE